MVILVIQVNMVIVEYGETCDSDEYDDSCEYGDSGHFCGYGVSGKSSKTESLNVVEDIIWIK